MKEETTQKKDPLRDKSLQFAIRIVRLHEYLVDKKREFTMSKQILKSGTNPGAMVREAAYAESGNDFIHKLSVGQKENNETQYWLELLYATDYITKKEFTSLIADSEEIGRLLTSSIKTKKKKLGIAIITFLAIMTGCLKYALF